MPSTDFPCESNKFTSSARGSKSSSSSLAPLGSKSSSYSIDFGTIFSTYAVSNGSSPASKSSEDCFGRVGGGGRTGFSVNKIIFFECHESKFFNSSTYLFRVQIQTNQQFQLTVQLVSVLLLQTLQNLQHQC